ncbi:MAG: AAA family ATPase [Planctomycetota bacterium]
MPENAQSHGAAAPTGSDHASRDERVAADLAVLDALPARVQLVRERVRRVVIGQHEAVELLIAAVLGQRHTLLTGVPGLGKTLLVRTLAHAFGTETRRVQFTPDMLPGDLLGGEVLLDDAVTGRRRLEFRPGPVFTEVLLADEINRTPPRTQSALLECMESGAVSLLGRTHRLPEPFVVLATQNPIEQEGTYPLPEAQLDRFTFSIMLGYPSPQEERLIAARGVPDPERAEPVFAADELPALRALIAEIPVGESLVDEAVAIVRATRPDDASAPREIRASVEYGAGPRAARDLIDACRIMAAMQGEPAPRPEHLRSLVGPVLRHRLVLGYAAQSEGVSPDDLLERAVASAR